MIDPIPTVIRVLKEAFPAYRPSLGTGLVSLTGEKACTVSASAQPVTVDGEITRWIIDVAVYDMDRGRAMRTSTDMLTVVTEAADDGRLGVSSWQMVTMPSLIPSSVSSQAHAIVEFTIQCYSRFGRN